MVTYLKYYAKSPKQTCTVEFISTLCQGSGNIFFSCLYIHANILFCFRVWLLYPCESIVESMGSVLKNIFGEHRNLAPENAEKELIIAWNGKLL